jgi:hypothetical protein
MTDPNWDSGTEVKVPAQPARGNWTCALEYVDASKRLKFIVEDSRNAEPAAAGPPAADAAALGGQAQVNHPARELNQWSYAKDKQCGADGDPKAPVNPSNCLISDAPPGSLIAKIGGSVAGKTNDGVKSFVVGSFCVVDLDDKSKGALYLAMNADPMGSLPRSGHLCIKVYCSK